MKTARYIILVAFFAAMAVGCEAGPKSPEEIQQEIAMRKENFECMRLVVEEQLEPMADLFEVRWSLPVHDASYTRLVEKVQVLERMICLYGDDGNLMFVDAERGSAKSFFSAGYDEIIFPIDCGIEKIQQGEQQISRKFVYLSNGKQVFSLPDPMGRSGALYPRWTADSKSPILTPIVHSEYALFFGCADGKVYSLSKINAGEISALRPILRVKSEINIGIPVAMPKDSNYPFGIDDDGNLYLYDGLADKEHKPIRTDLPRPIAPMLVDDETKTLLVAGADFRIYALDAVAGQEKKWVAYTRGSYVTGEMKLHNGRLYACNEKNELLAFSMLGGTPLWDGKVVSKVAKIVGPTRDGNLFLMMDYGTLAKLDVQTGKILFERPLPEVQFVLGDWTNCVVYLVNDLGRIWAISER